jgi:hypothetical protein
MTARITINIDDVRLAGSVPAAIETECDASDTIASGIVGPSFSTSGPGAGWSKNHGPNDYAIRAMEEGAEHYIDIEDGLMRSVVPIDEAEARDEDGDIMDDTYCSEGVYFRVGDWTEESVVRVECPDIDDALKYPEIAAQMARSVADHHYAESDRQAWKSLVAGIRKLSEAFADMSLDHI